MPNNRKPPDDLTPDTHLWDSVSTTIKPLAPAKRDRHIAKPERVAIAAVMQNADAVAVTRAVDQALTKPPVDRLTWTEGSGYSRPDQRQIKAGALRPTATLDLHGYTVARAETALNHFLRQAVRDGHGWVEIITGHGRFYADGDGDKGVLKRLLPEWLNQPAQRALIKRVLPAPKSRGGAVWVALRTAD